MTPQVIAIVYAAFVMGFLSPMAWNMSGFSGDVIEEIRQEFSSAPEKLRPEVLRANTWWRCCLRVSLLAFISGAFVSGFLKSPGWQWMIVVSIQVAVVLLMREYNHRKYWKDLGIWQRIQRTRPSALSVIDQSTSIPTV